jgi:hypothetical protein
MIKCVNCDTNLKEKRNLCKNCLKEIFSNEKINYNGFAITIEDLGIYPFRTEIICGHPNCSGTINKGEKVVGFNVENRLLLWGQMRYMHFSCWNDFNENFCEKE